MAGIVEQKHSRREVLLKGGLAVVGGVLGVSAAKLSLPEAARAEGIWTPTWIDQQTNFPQPITGASDERVPMPLVIAAGSTSAVTCGPFSYADKFGVSVDFLGGAERASIAVIKGPSGIDSGGVGISPLVAPRSNWYGRTLNPVGGLQSGDLEAIIVDREASLRSAVGGSFLNGPIDVVVINGRDGSIEKTETRYPKRTPTFRTFLPAISSR